MADFYPDQSLVMPMTVIRRERLLPPGARGRVLVREGQRVGAFELVARGVIATRYLIVNLTAALGVRDPKALDELLVVSPGEVVDEGRVIARDRRRERDLLHAPATGVVAQMHDGRLILETGLRQVEVRAGFDGVVASLRGERGVLLETTGTLVQGAWGNGRTHYGLLKLEPEDGLESLVVDEFETAWRDSIVVVKGPLTRSLFRRARDQGLGGLIAPGMDAHLRESALGLKMPVLLTEGFGARQMSPLVYNVLAECAGRQVSLEANAPRRQESERPEVIAPLHQERMLPTLSPDEPLRVGAEVRITREPYLGVVARVKNLPPQPRLIENGLRLPVAEVSLPSGRDALVPLANLELLGRK